MNDIAESLLDAGYFATHTRALVFASRAIGDRPIPRAVSNFSGLNFLVGLMLVLAGVVTTVAYGFLFIAWDQNVLTYFYLVLALNILGTGLFLMFQEVVLRIGLIKRRRTDVERLWRRVFKDSTAFPYSG